MAKGKRQQRRRQTRSRGSASRTGPSTGATTSKAELGLQLVDFFDYEYGATGTPTYGSVKHYYFDTNQNLFDNNPLAADGQASSFCRVRKLEVYILPRRNLDQGAPSPDFTSNASAMFTCNMYTPALAGYTRPFSAVGNSTSLATNNQVTNILPQIDTFWKKVYSCNMQKTFQSGVIRPYYYGNRQCLFSMRLLDPTDGLDYAGIGNEALKVRVKVVMHVDQPIMPIQRALVNVLSNFDVGKPDVDGDGNDPVVTIKPQYVQMDLKKVLHNFR